MADKGPSLAYKPSTKVIKVLYRKNLSMSPGKIAAQAVHAALGLEQDEITFDMPVIVLGVTDLKFNAEKSNLRSVVIRDAGLTEVPKGTETCLAYIE